MLRITLNLSGVMPLKNVAADAQSQYMLQNSPSVADTELKVDIINQKFSSAFSSNSSIVDPKPPLYDVSHKMKPNLIADTIVLKELISIKLNKSAGAYASIHPRILHEC